MVPTKFDYFNELGNGGVLVLLVVLFLWPVGYLINSPIAANWGMCAIATVSLMMLSMHLDKKRLPSQLPLSAHIGSALLRLWWFIVAQWIVIHLRVFFCAMDVIAAAELANAEWVMGGLLLACGVVLYNATMLGRASLRIFNVWCLYERQTWRVLDNGPDDPVCLQEPYLKWSNTDPLIITSCWLLLGFGGWLGADASNQPRALIDLMLSIYVTAAFTILHLHVLKAQQKELEQWGAMPPECDLKRE